EAAHLRRRGFLAAARVDRGARRYQGTGAGVRGSGRAVRSLGALGALGHRADDQRASRRGEARADARGRWSSGPEQLRQARAQRTVSAAGQAAPLLLPAIVSRRGSGSGAGRDARAASRRDAGSHPWTGRADGPLRPFLTPGMGVPLADQADRDRIRAALSTTLLVEAAAGPGKTTALVGRMLAALASGRARLDRMV